MLKAWTRNFILPFLSAISIIIAIEGALWLKFHPDFWARTRWFSYDVFREERTERLIVYEKLSHLVNTNPDIISLGDSTGLHCIQPTIVNRYLGGVHKYVNINTIAQHTMDGHLAMAEYMLERSPSIKYILLYVYPSLLPSPWLEHQAEGGRVLKRDLEGFGYWLTPPSGFLTPYAKKIFFEGKHFDPNALLSPSAPYREFHYAIDTTLGWMPEQDLRFDHVNARVEFHPDRIENIRTLGGLLESSIMLSKLGEMANLAQRHHVQLLIAFGPVPSTAIDYQNPNLLKGGQLLEEFQHLHPEVKFITNYITPWDIAKFSEYNHVAREYSHETSERLGMALAKALNAPQSIKPFVSEPKNYVFPKIKILKEAGEATQAQKNAALAYYAYTVTGQQQYYTLLSERVQALLAKSKSFGYMMEDKYHRDGVLKEKGVSLSFDSSKMTAKQVKISGGSYCGNSRQVTWIKLVGSIDLGVTTHDLTTSSASVWNDNSNIIIPIITENGLPRFDGYCPAPMEDGR